MTEEERDSLHKAIHNIEIAEDSFIGRLWKGHLESADNAWSNKKNWNPHKYAWLDDELLPGRPDYPDGYTIIIEPD
jgi:hypothetical protein